MPMQPSIRTGAFTVIEVMISVAILAVATMGLVVHMSNQNTARGVMARTSQADAVMRSVVERLMGMPWEEVGTGWSAPRHYANGTTDTGLSEADLIGYGIIPRATGLERLAVHIEYYRAVTVRDASGAPDPARQGIMDADLDNNGIVDMDSPDDFQRVMFPGDWTGGVRPAFYLGGGADPAGWYTAAGNQGIKAANVVGELDPVLIRIVVTWGARIGTGSAATPSYHLQTVTARRP